MQRHHSSSWVISFPHLMQFDLMVVVAGLGSVDGTEGRPW